MASWTWKALAAALADADELQWRIPEEPRRDRNHYNSSSSDACACVERNNNLATDSAFRWRARWRFFCRCHLGRVRIFFFVFFFLRVCAALKRNRSKGDKSKAANAVLITYVFEGPGKVLGLQMVPFAYVSPGEQTLTCYLPLWFGPTTTTHCVSLPGREEKQNKAKHHNEMRVGGSTVKQ